MDNLEEVIVIDPDDDDDDDFDDYRNARRRSRRRRRSRGRGRSRGRSGRRRTGSIARGRSSGFDRQSAGPVVRQDTGGLSYGILIEAGAQVLAAIQSLPSPPVSTGEVAVDVGNLMLYQQALAEHAKRDEQLRTVGSLAAKVLA